MDATFSNERYSFFSPLGLIPTIPYQKSFLAWQVGVLNKILSHCRELYFSGLPTDLGSDAYLLAWSEKLLRGILCPSP